MLLEHMTDEQKFGLSAKLCGEVLGPIVDGVIPLTTDADAVMQDTLVVLASKVGEEYEE